MSKVIAYQCDYTGKLFIDEDKYKKHLRKLADQRRRERKAAECLRLEKQWWADNFWNNVKSLDQLKYAIIYHRDVFAARGVKESTWGRTHRLKPTPLVEFTTFDLRYGDSVSNSHRCPHDGETNWGGYKKDVPRGYPGWSGRFDYLVQSCSGQLNSYPGGSDMWVRSRIGTGTGGGGGCKKGTSLQSFGYQLELFCSDWPAMATAYEQAKVWKTLNNDQRSLDFIVNQMFPAEAYRPADVCS